MEWLYRHRRWVIVAAVAVLIAIVLPHLRSLEVQDITDYAPESIPLAMLVFLAIYVIKSIVMFIPVAILYIAAGIVFPPGWAIVITWADRKAEYNAGRERLKSGNTKKYLWSNNSCL